MESRFERKPDGQTEMVNMFVSEGHSVSRMEAFANAVLVQMVEGEPDEETGEPRYVRYVSLIVKDAAMEPVLRAEAQRILSGDAP